VSNKSLKYNPISTNLSSEITRTSPLNCACSGFGNSGAGINFNKPSHQFANHLFGFLLSIHTAR
jgi:hypothetical protein